MKTVFIFSLLVASAAFAGSSKLSPELQSPAADNLDVIVQYRQIPGDAQHQKVKAKGGVLNAKLDAVKGAHYSVPASVLNDLAGDPDVVYVSPDRALRGMLDYANPTVNANLARQANFDGSGVGVAIVDSGINPDSDISSYR